MGLKATKDARSPTLCAERHRSEIFDFALGSAEEAAFSSLEAGIAEAIQVGPDVAQAVDAELEILGELAEERRRFRVRTIGELTLIREKRSTAKITQPRRWVPGSPRFPGSAFGTERPDGP